MNKRAQVVLFIILAIVIVAIVAIFIAFRGELFGVGEPSGEFVQIFDLYGECLKQEVDIGLDILGTQGGRIDIGDYFPGSEYAPFSSHLNFVGIQVPYWYYIAGNNVVREQSPTKSEMEKELEEYIASRINDCDFIDYYEQGYYVELPESVSVSASILDTSVRVELKGEVSASRNGETARKNEFNVEVQSKIGKFYGIARKVYDKELMEAFLEDYAVDVLRNYAPVDGVKIQCGPEIWSVNQIVDDLQDGFEANFASLKFSGSYYELQEKGDYFVVDLGEEIDEPVRVMYSREWPIKVDVTPADDEILIAKPVGTQRGLAAMGFCYVPYHFIYDVSFPVMIQISDGLEIFQFPFAVIIDNNVAREAQLMSIADVEKVDVCRFSEGNVEIHTFDRELRPVSADVSFRCFDSVCPLGRTQVVGNEAVLSAKVPLCVNGFLEARASGYADEKVIFSSNREDFAEVFLEREHEVLIDLLVDGRPLTPGQTALVHFDSGESGTVSAALPENSIIDLREGGYKVYVYVYGDSSIEVPTSTRRNCVDVPKGGAFGVFGATEEECFDVEIPGFELDYALIGGGNSDLFILESDLARGKIVLDVESLPSVTSIEQLQNNYEAFESAGVDVFFQ